MKSPLKLTWGAIVSTSYKNRLDALHWPTKDNKTKTLYSWTITGEVFTYCAATVETSVVFCIWVANSASRQKKSNQPAFLKLMKISIQMQLVQLNSSNSRSSSKLHLERYCSSHRRFGVGGAGTFAVFGSFLPWPVWAKTLKRVHQCWSKLASLLISFEIVPFENSLACKLYINSSGKVCPIYNIYEYAVINLRLLKQTEQLWDSKFWPFLSLAPLFILFQHGPWREHNDHLWCQLFTDIYLRHKAVNLHHSCAIILQQ